MAPMPGLDDAALVRRIAAARPGRDAGAETELCRRMAPRVRLYGLRHLRDPHAAADLAQQVLMMTLERLRDGKLREPDMLASFMFGMCRTVLFDAQRSYARRERLLNTFADDVPGADSPSADPALSLRLDVARLAMSRRPGGTRALGAGDDLLRGAAGLGNSGRRLGLSEGNVRVIRHRGLQRLRDCVMGGAGARA